MKVKLKDKPMDVSWVGSYKGMDNDVFEKLNNGGVVELDSIPKYAKDFVVEVNDSPKPKTKKDKGE